MKKTGIFLLLFTLGMIVFFAGGYWTGVSSFWRTVIKCSLPLLLLGATVFCGRRESTRRWSKVTLAFLSASTGFLVSWLLSDHLLALMGAATDTVSGIALAKMTESVLIVVPAYLVARAGGMTNREMYLCPGKSKAWLIIGIGAFIAFSLLFLAQVTGSGLDRERIIDLLPWALLFVLMNGLMEEFHFRGLLLSPLEGLLGRHGSNLCIALFFTLIHTPVQYTSDIIGFLSVLMILALLWGYLIQKTRSLWGAVLFHAGADLLIVAGIFETYGG